MRHPNDCRCGRCEGIRRYPLATTCDWCHGIHNGDANNCTPEEEVAEFEPETITDEQLMWATIAAVKQITKKIKENTMIPSSTTGQQANTSRRGNQQAVRSGLPYLNQTNMGDYLELNVKYPAKIIDCRVNTSAPSPVTLKLAIKGKTCLWGLKTNNPSLAILTDLFGNDENNWAGQNFQMWLHEDEFDGRIWPTCGPAEKEKKVK
jgi:hypothetical protein